MKKNLMFISMVSPIIAALIWTAEPTHVWSARSWPETNSATTSDKVKTPADTESERLYQLGMKAVEAENYQKAFDYFWQASRLERDNPNVLNMLAYTQRKLGNFDEAFRYYKMALKLRPNFPQAREYLGEAHIQAALEQIRILKSYGPNAQKEFEDLMESFKKAVETLPRK